MTISKDKLMASLKKLNGCAIASIDSKTKVKLTGGKKNEQQGRIEKIMEHGNIMLFCNMNSNGYNNMVKRRLAKEGKNPDTFKLSPRRWGERVPNTPFVLHKGKIYVEAIFLQKPTKVSYLQDGRAIDKADITGLPKAKEGEQGGLSDKVVIRTYALESITKLRMGDLTVE